LSPPQIFGPATETYCQHTENAQNAQNAARRKTPQNAANEDRYIAAPQKSCNTGNRSHRRDILVLFLVNFLLGRTRMIKPPVSRGVGTPSRIVSPGGTAAAAHDVVVVFVVVGR
jgi:hypothetical protein